MRSLAPDVEALVRDAFRLAATDVFRVGAWVGAASVAVALTIPHVPLRTSIDVDSGGE